MLPHVISGRIGDQHKTNAVSAQFQVEPPALRYEHSNSHRTPNRANTPRTHLFDVEQQLLPLQSRWLDHFTTHHNPEYISGAVSTRRPPPQIILQRAGASGRDPNTEHACEPAHVEGSGVLAADRDGGGDHVPPSRLRPQLFSGGRRPGSAGAPRSGPQVRCCNSSTAVKIDYGAPPSPGGLCREMFEGTQGPYCCSTGRMCLLRSVISLP